MISLSFIICHLSFSPTGAQAAERTEAEMLTIARQQMAPIAKARGHNAAAADLSLSKVMSAESYSVYEAPEGAGFVVVSRDDALQPVLGYAEGAFVAGEENPALAWWLKVINQSLKAQPLKTRAANATRAAADFTPVADLLPSRWGQGSPFNYSCPKVNGVSCLTGCPATALSQLLYYYQYPERSVGTASYTIANGQPVAVELNTTFKWASMRKTYGGTAYSNTVKQAIGELMRDCGYASITDYNISASGAYPYDVARALVRNLQFDTLNVNYIRRDFYTDEEWMAVIYSELAAERPILYTGTDGAYGGHIFVLTGVDEKGLVFCNWGWNGDGNGFFDLEDLVVTGILGSSNELDFSNEQYMIYGVTPDQPAAGKSYTYSHFVTDSHNYALQARQSNQITLGGLDLYNINFMTFHGDIELVFVSEEGKTYEIPIPVVADNMPETGVPTMAGFSVPARTNVDVSVVPEGIYTLYLASKAAGESKPRHIRCKGTGALEFPVEKYESGSMTVYDAKVVNALDPNETEDDGVSHKYEFVDKVGNVVPNGSSLTLTDITEDPFGDSFISSGLYVKNVSGGDSQVIRVAYNVLEISNGSFQICFPSACVTQDKVGQFLTQAGSTPGESVSDLQTEWFFTDYGSCLVELQLQEGTRDPLTRLFTKTADGPKVTLRFSNPDPAGISALPMDETGVAGCFTLSGSRADAQTKGVNIIRRQDGTVRKIVMK